MRLYLLFAALLAVAACDKPMCQNKNEVLMQHKINSLLYNEELVRNMTAAKGLDYSIYDYREEGGRSYIVTDVVGNGLCAMLWLDVTTPPDSAMNLVKEKKALSFRGAGIRNLRYEIVRDTNIRFVYKGADGISD